MRGTSLQESTGKQEQRLSLWKKLMRLKIELKRQQLFILLKLVILCCLNYIFLCAHIEIYINIKFLKNELKH